MSADYFVVRLLGGALWAVPLERAVGTLAVAPSEICPVPGVDSALLGAINQRGQLLWVLDLQAALSGLNAASTQRSRRTLTLLAIDRASPGVDSASGRSRLACVVAELVEIVRFEADTFSAPADVTLQRFGYSERGRSLLRGMAEYQGEPVAILDADALFDTLQPSHSSRSLVYS